MTRETRLQLPIEETSPAGPGAQNDDAGHGTTQLSAHPLGRRLRISSLHKTFGCDEAITSASAPCLSVPLGAPLGFMLGSRRLHVLNSLPGSGKSGLNAYSRNRKMRNKGPETAALAVSHVPLRATPKGADGPCDGARESRAADEVREQARSRTGFRSSICDRIF